MLNRRGLIRNPQIILLDDCLSAVDSKTEELILQNIKSKYADKSCIIVSHRASSIKHANQIILLKNGEIIEQGSHDSLMKLKGEYSLIYQRQLNESDNK